MRTDQQASEGGGAITPSAKVRLHRAPRCFVRPSRGRRAAVFLVAAAVLGFLPLQAQAQFTPFGFGAAEATTVARQAPVQSPGDGDFRLEGTASASVSELDAEAAQGSTPPTHPDLVIDRLSTFSSPGPWGVASLSLTATVRNDGDGDAATTMLRYYRSSDATITTSDTEEDTATIAALAAGETSAQSADLTPPSSPGTYYYGACVDAVSGESDTTNNCSASMKVTVWGAARSDLSVADAEATEGEDATLDFVVTLDPAASGTVTVNYATADGTATANADYTPTSGTLTFPAGETTKTIAVPITDDTVEDDGETLTLTLSSASGAAITDAEATGTIHNTEPPTRPDLVIDGLSTFSSPGAWGIASLSLTATVRNDGDGDAATTMLRYYRSSDATITTSDTEEDTATIAALAAGETSAQSADLTPPSSPGTYYYGACVDAVSGESDTTNNCSASMKVTVWGAARSDLSVADAEATEGEDATLDFVVTLDPAASGTVTVNYATADGTATANADYTPTSGTLTFPAGETTKTIAVPIADDTVEDDGETFTLTLSNASGATITDAEATGTILNTESQPDSLTAQFTNVPASHSGAAPFTFGLTFSEELEPAFSYKTLRDDAFDVMGGTVRSARRKQQGSNLAWDITVEPSGPADVTITLPETTNCGASGAICTGDGRPLSNSPSATVAGPVTIPTVSVSDASATEGVAVEFQVSLSAASSQQVTVQYATSGGTATSGTDFTSESRTLTFGTNETTKTVSVATTDDAVDEDDETFTLTLSSPANATMGDATATGTIRDDDDLPTVSVSDASATEGGTVEFTVSLSAASAKQVTVQYATSGGTAASGTDFTSESGTLTFAADETSKTICRR